ncbi:hypothetical protein Dsin_032435 [Dipteronia sinensis]|uniref:J domain-containing protein n=1 Tax=Dipteronia sinensis TaxID=43782 RepID=A0AAE0DTA7_9ROSI|nr:hypothetical protein Dsin_032435 [Dipteronia sinensis]
MASGGYRVEAEPWLSTAEKLLVAHDFHGARTFAIRVRESYPRLEAPSQILAVADTLIAGESLIVTAHGNHHHDWYAILQVPRFCTSIELIATQYRKFAVLLNPDRNRLPFSDQSFKLVSDAWLVLSNPTRKMMYDSELQLSQLGERPRQTQTQMQPPPPPPPQQPARKSPKSRERDGNDRVIVEEQVSNLNHVAASTTPQTRTIQAESTRVNQRESTRPSIQTESTRPSIQTESTRPSIQTESTRPSIQTESSRPNRTESARRSETESETTGSFWTACPYCYVLYEYQKVYEECVLRCQNCRRAFHAVAIPSPPVSATAKDSYFCCWGFYPLGYSGNSKDSAKWTPVSPMVPCQGPEGEGGGGGGGGAGGGKSKQNNNATKRAPVLYDEVVISDSEPDPVEESDDEWQKEKRKKKVKNVKGKGSESTRKNVKRPQAERVNKKGNNQNQVQNQSAGGENANATEGNVGTSSGGSRVLRSSGRKQMGNGLDLNVEFSNEPEDPVAQGIRQEHGEEDNIDGVGFFEGLDEFLSSLPILNVVRDDKVKPT